MKRMLSYAEKRKIDTWLETNWGHLLTSNYNLKETAARAEKDLGFIVTPHNIASMLKSIDKVLPSMVRMKKEHVDVVARSAIARLYNAMGEPLPPELVAYLDKDTVKNVSTRSV